MQGSLKMRKKRGEKLSPSSVVPPVPEPAFLIPLLVNVTTTSARVIRLTRY